MDQRRERDGRGAAPRSEGALTAVEEQIFVPDIGFRPVETLIARVPVTRSADDLTVTVERAVAAPGSVDVMLRVTGQPDADSRRLPSFATDPVTLIEPDGRVIEQIPWRNAMGRLGGPPGTALETVRREIGLQPLSPGTREATLSVSGVTIPLAFEPGATLAARTYPLGATAERHGITVSARCIAFTTESTAVDLAVRLTMAGAHVRSLGMSLGPNASDAALRDDQGRFYGAQRAISDTRPSRERKGEYRETAVFPALPRDVRTISLEIADVTVVEQTDDLTLPVGFDGEITLGGLTGHTKVLRESDERRAQRRERLAARLSVLGAGQPAPVDEEYGRLEVECGDGPWAGGRRLLRPNNVWLTNGTRECSMSFDHRGWVLSVPDLSSDATAVTISSALVQYRGPWTLEVTLPRRDGPSEVP